MNTSKKTPFDDVLEHSVADFLTNASDGEVTAFFQGEGLDAHALARKGRDALAHARAAAASGEAKEASNSSVNPFSDIKRPKYRKLAQRANHPQPPHECYQEAVEIQGA